MRFDRARLWAAVRHRGPEVANLVAAFANIAAGLMLDSWWVVSSFNLVAGGWCLACAVYAQRVRVLDDENEELLAMLEAMSPEHMRATMHATLSALVEKMKADGVLPPGFQAGVEHEKKTVH